MWADYNEATISRKMGLRSRTCRITAKATLRACLGVTFLASWTSL
jgi:hypothetical protein